MVFVVSLTDAKASFQEYDFIRALTPGSQKAVFHVRDENGNDLCLKIIAPNYERDRLDREIQALQCLDHPNIARMKEYTFSSKPNQQRHYIIEEFVEGKDLSEELRPGQPWTPKQVAEFFAMLCDGLAVFKQKGIVHRDIKPHNIRVRHDGTPVLIDFGLARHLNLPDLTLTVEGAQIGTPLYFAPEQFDGTKHDIDHRTDLFAVGILIYEAMIGEHPFDNQNTTRAQLRNAVCEADDHLKRSAFVILDSDWKTLISKLLAKERVRRPADAAQVAKILRKIGGL